MGETGATDRTPDRTSAFRILCAAIIVIVSSLPFVTHSTSGYAERSGESAAIYALAVTIWLAAACVVRRMRIDIEGGSRPRSASSRAAWRALLPLALGLIMLALIAWTARWTGAGISSRSWSSEFLSGLARRMSVLAPAAAFGIAVVLAWAGRVVGSGLHCARCRYPAAESAGRCSECGAWLGDWRATTEGRIVRPRWLLATIGVVVLLASMRYISLDRYVNAAPTSLLLAVAEQPGLGLTDESVAVLETRALTAAQQTRLANAVIGMWERSPGAELKCWEVVDRSIVAGLLTNNGVERLVRLLIDRQNSPRAWALLDAALLRPLSAQQQDTIANWLLDALARDSQFGYLVGEHLMHPYVKGELSPAIEGRIGELMRAARWDESNVWVWMWYDAAMFHAPIDVRRRLLAECIDVLRQPHQPSGAGLVRRDVIEQALRFEMISESEADAFRRACPCPLE